MNYGRVDKLTHALLMAAREENEIVGFESEAWGGPGERVLEFGGCGHLVVCIDGEFGGSLDRAILADVAERMGFRDSRPVAFE